VLIRFIINHTNTKSSNIDLKDCIAKVVDSKNNFYGFAFFIHNRYCVTCHHCICEIEDEIYIQRDNKKYPVKWIEEYSDMTKNVAVLRINDTTTPTANFKPLGCSEEEALASTSSSSFSSYYCTWIFLPHKIDNFSAVSSSTPVKCQLKETHLHFQWKEEEGEQETKTTTTTITGKQRNKKSPIDVDVNVYAIPEKKKLLDVNFSGAPICHVSEDDDNGYQNIVVLGMLTDNYKDENFCYAIPIRTIVKRFNDSNDEIVAWVDKGLSLYKSGKLEKAIECYDNALKINPSYYKACLLKAETLYALGEYQKAHTYYTRAAELNPDQNNNNPELATKSYFVYYLARDEAKVKQYDHLSSAEIKKIKNPRDFLSALSSQGENFINLSNYEKAVECFDKALNLDSNSAGVWNDKGFALHFLGKYKEAIECYDNALRLKPDYIDALNDKGFALDKLGEHEKAIKCFDKAREIDLPNNYKEYIWSNKGRIFQSLQKYKEAIECYDNTLQLTPNDIDIWKQKGNCLFSLGVYEEAIKCYDKGLQMDPENLEILNRKHEALEKLI
jgi:tetratricopeptide (TPR) repeat protein